MPIAKVKKTEAEWKKELGANYNTLRQQGTERPGTGEYDRFAPKEGYFGCGACSLPLYTASSKFPSRCGWPCFDKVIWSNDGCHVGTRSHFGQVEIICNACDSHLGHVFYGENCTPTNERH
mmetsp:Transcript_16513/g.36488  ORF Transcript_16513/g.36488 Transcript_16513/m.36488 type:complete len:121 (-) Transcript_16513:662-1024(-)